MNDLKNNTLNNNVSNITVHKKISKKTLQKSWFRWFYGSLSSLSFEWLAAFGFAHSMAPVIEELYKDDKQAQIAGLQRQSNFYNTEPQIGSVINGMVCGLEEERANGADISDEVINGIKIGLMGPLAGIGDAMLPGMFIPLLLSIGMGLATDGSILGPIFYIITFLSTIPLLSYYLFMQGYKLGTKSVDLIIGEATKRARESFNMLGSIVVGGVAASYIGLTTILAIPQGDGASTILVNEVLNGIYPKLLPLLAAIFCWWLMSKKKVSALMVMGILVVLAFIGVILNIF